MVINAVGSSANAATVPAGTNQLVGTSPAQPDVASSGTASGSPALNSENLAKTLNQLNQQLQPSGHQVRFASDSPPGAIWLNVVDPQGQVLQRIPAEGVRKLLDAQTTGLAFDLNY